MGLDDVAVQQLYAFIYVNYMTLKVPYDSRDLFMSASWPTDSA